MTPTKPPTQQIADGITQARELLDRADNQGAGQAQIGSLIIAISHLADAMEALNARCDRIVSWMDMHQH